jgi:A/G-specific adenine glycosylase
MSRRPSPSIPRVRRLLLRHYDEHRRALPWRDVSDPYGTWVSEVMLQQTRVETVIPYYLRWMDRFPSLDTLADAPEDDVLELWKGLGYYSRARNLQSAARLVRERHDGRLPREVAELSELPGIGTYTAGAIASIAFGARAPAVDGNTRRVLCRLFNLPSPSPDQLHDLADAVVDPRRPGDFNQALMDLGAIVCTPRSPRCGSCPLSKDCRAAAEGVAESRPLPTRRARPPERAFAVAVLVDPRGRALLVRRPPRGLLAGLWAFPESEMEGHASAARVAKRVARDLGHPRTSRAHRLDSVRHTFTHLRAHYFPHLMRTLETDVSDDADRRWMDPARLDGLAVPAAQQRIAEATARAL